MSLPMRWNPVEMSAVIEPQPQDFAPRRRSAAHKAPFQLSTRILVKAMITVALLLGITALLRGAVSLGASPGLVSVPDRSKSVQIISSSAERQHGFVTITGSASSRVGKNLTDLETVVELLDKNHHPLHMETALLPMPLAASGEAAPFRVELPDDSKATSYRIRFRKLMGASLP